MILPATFRALIVGIGNDFRGDDAAGLEVARLLHARGLPNVDVRECGGDIAELVDLWDSYDTVIAVDAVRSGAQPGTIVHFDARRETVPSVFIPHVSSHGSGLAEAIELAEALGQLPRSLHIYGVEGSTFEIGAAMSDPVRRAVGILADLINRDLTAVRAPRGQGVV